MVAHRSAVKPRNLRVEVGEWFDLMFQPDDWFEVRAILHNPKKPDMPRKEAAWFRMGFYKQNNDLSSLGRKILEKAEGEGEDDGAIGIYFTPNPVSPSLSQRGKAVNVFVRPGWDEETGKSRIKFAHDADVPVRRWLIVDVDPVRAAGFEKCCTTDAEKEAGRSVAMHVRDFLYEHNWHSITVDSGNGFHLYCRLPNELPGGKADSRTDPLARLLRALKAKFDTAGAKIDGDVFNASRIMKIPGTWARKGPNTPDRPHRRSCVEYVSAAWGKPRHPKLPPASIDDLLGVLPTVELPPEPSPPVRPLPPLDTPSPEQLAKRVRAWIKAGPAAKSQNGGHKRTFAVAQALVNGFLLSRQQALDFLWNDFNPMCKADDRWTLAELEHKVDDAIAQPCVQEPGWLLNAERPNSRSKSRPAATNTEPGAARQSPAATAEELDFPGDSEVVSVLSCVVHGANDGPATTSGRFKIGDKVIPGDRKNFGTITDTLPGGRYTVHFVGKNGNVADKEFAESELRPADSTQPMAGFKPGAQVAPFVPFPLEALPMAIRPFVEAVSAAIPCDPAFVALPALITCGIACGAARVARLKKSWVEPPVLWGIVVGASGTMKSPAVEKAVEPLYKINHELVAKSAKAIRDYRNRPKLDDSVKELFPGLSTTDDPNEPPKERCIASDITIEALCGILEKNPKGLLIFRDELASWFHSLTRYSRGVDTTSDWLSLYNARPLTMDRKTGDKVSFNVPHATVALAGTIQPKVLTDAFTEGFRSCGGAARLLLVMPPAQQKLWTDDDIPDDVAADYEKVIRHLRSLEPERDDDGGTRPVHVLFSKPSLQRLKGFVNEWGGMTQEAGEQNDDLGALYSKMEGAAARLALIHHLTCVAGGGITYDEIELESMEAGIIMAKWFAAETERVYATLCETDDDKRVRLLVEKVRKSGGRMTPRKLQNGNNRKYRKVEDAIAALDALVRCGFGVWEETKPAGGGRPSREFVLCTTHDKTDTTSESPGET